MIGSEGAVRFRKNRKNRYAEFRVPHKIEGFGLAHQVMFNEYEEGRRSKVFQSAKMTPLRLALNSPFCKPLHKVVTRAPSIVQTSILTMNLKSGSCDW